jgi:hypothetical protein
MKYWYSTPRSSKNMLNIEKNKWYGCNIDATRGICFQCYLLRAKFFIFIRFMLFFASEAQKNSHGIVAVTRE